MELDEAKSLATSLMTFYELNTQGWVFEFDRAKRRNGLCSYKTKTISLSKYYIELNEKWLVEDTIRHEIAHALVGAGHGHDDVWKSKAESVGAKPVRCKTDVKQLIGKIKYRCPNCNLTICQHRQIRKNAACADCCKRYNYGKYDSKYKFEKVKQKWMCINKKL